MSSDRFMKDDIAPDGTDLDAVKGGGIVSASATAGDTSASVNDTSLSASGAGMTAGANAGLSGADVAASGRGTSASSKQKTPRVSRPRRKKLRKS